MEHQRYCHHSLFNAAIFNCSVGLDSGLNPQEYKNRKAQGIATRMANYLRPVYSKDMGKATSTDKSRETLSSLLDSFGV